VLGLWLGFERTRFGAQIRAAVDNRRMAESLGINIDRLFAITFAFGSGMAALGGGLGAEFLGLDPQYPLKYLVFFLIVVASADPVASSARLCRVDNWNPRLRTQTQNASGRHALHLCPHHPAVAMAAAGTVRKIGMSAPASPTSTPRRARSPDANRIRLWESIPWLLAIASTLPFRAISDSAPNSWSPSCSPSRSISRWAMRASSRSPRAFLRRRRLYRGMLAYHNIWNEPITGLVAAAVVAGAVGYASGLVLLRTTGLTLPNADALHHALLEESANLGGEFTGGFDGLPGMVIRPLFGLFEFNPLYPRVQYLYVLGVTVHLFCVRAHAGLFALRAELDRHPREPRCACTRSARRCARGSSSATPSRLRSQASPAVYGRSRTLTSISARSASTAPRLC